MALGVVSNFYGDGDNFGNLLQSQSSASPGIGYEAARLADPFGNERKQYQNKLRTLVDDPGSFSSSPFYKFAYDQGLNALQRKGSVRSGNKLAELMRYGQGMASQAYFPQANLLSTLSGATTGSPAAAGLAVSGAFERSQNQANLAAALKAMKGAQGNQSAQMAPFNPAGTPMPSRPAAGGYGGSSLGPIRQSDYTPQPSSMAGTGYISSGSGVYNFGSPMSGDSYYTAFSPGYGNDYGAGYSSGYDYLSQPSYTFMDGNSWAEPFTLPTGGLSDFGSSAPSYYDPIGYDAGYSDYYDPGYVSDYGWDEF